MCQAVRTSCNICGSFPFHQSNSVRIHLLSPVNFRGKYNKQNSHNHQGDSLFSNVGTMFIVTEAICCACQPSCPIPWQQTPSFQCIAVIFRDFLLLGTAIDTHMQLWRKSCLLSTQPFYKTDSLRVTILGGMTQRISCSSL